MGTVTGMGGFPPTNSGGNKVFVAATRICLSQNIRYSYWPLQLIAEDANTRQLRKTDNRGGRENASLRP